MFNLSALNLVVPQQPRRNNLIVLPLVKAGTSFLIDMEENRELPEKGLVIAVGPGGVGPETGHAIPMDSTLGQLVCFGKYAGMKWTIAGPDGQQIKVFILRDSEVLLSQEAATLDLVIHEDDPAKIHEAGWTCEFCAKVDGEAGVNRLRAIAGGADPDQAALDVERARSGPALVTVTD